MRKRIEELANGRIECFEPIVEFSVSKIELEVFEGKDIAGEFTITSTNHVPMRGMVYSSNPRMECLTPRFEGEEIRVRYEFHSVGLKEGNIQKGDFYIICNQGEYNLSFVAVISKLYADSEAGIIRDLRDFTKLAQSNWQEAKRIFYTPGFINIIQNQKTAERLLYSGIAKGIPSDRNLEEFLLACRQKKQIQVQTKQCDFTFYQVTETIRQTITISKDTWGYVELDVMSDADFIEPEKDRITSEEFIGSEAEIGFYLYPEKMHAGKNYGCLVLRDIHQEIVVSICATFDKEGTIHHAVQREIRTLHAQLMKSYVDFRLKKVVTGKWAFRTCRILDSLIARVEENIWYRLLKAQVFLTNGQRQEAEWILSDFKRKWKDKKAPEWGYYMYICTLMEHEELYIDRLTEEIEQIYLEHRENTMLFWCLLFLREDYVQNRYQKLKALEERIMEGTESPILYVEVYCLYCQEPYLLNRIGEFEGKVLNWIRKQKMLTKELVDQVVSVFPERMSYQRGMLLLLESCYEQAEEEQILSVICGYLIRNQKYGKRFFMWYEKGIEAKLRITGLYEAYLMSMDTRSIQEVPQIIQMYFKYNNQLGYKQKAVLYVSIIARKNQQPEVYEQYYSAMERFAYEQMEQKRMDDNLAVIYEDVLAHGIHSPQLCTVLSDILFVHKLTCFAAEAARVIVLQKQIEKPKVVPLVNGVAYFSIYSNDYSIFIEDYHGNRYSGSVIYQLEKLMYPARYLKICMKNAPNCLSYSLYYFANRQAQEEFEEKDLVYFEQVIESDTVSRVYKAKLFPKMFHLLARMGRQQEMKQRLHQIDISVMGVRERASVLENCIELQLYEEAYQIVEEYGFEQLPVLDRVRLLNAQILHTDYGEEENLMQFCADTFLNGKYNDTMLEYLCRYYVGPIKTMVAIFCAARSFEVDTTSIAEQILVQMLYTGEFVDCMDEIYASYKLQGNPKLKRAYFTYFSHSYFAKDMVVSENFFAELQEWMKRENDVNIPCELAILKHMVTEVEPAEQDMNSIETLLKKYLMQDMQFAFYKKLSLELRLKYQLYDKYFIEYHTSKNAKVLLYYKMRDTEEEYLMEDLDEIYDGMFVKEIVLFMGESVQYYIEEEKDGQMEVTESGILKWDGMQEISQRSRYERLNEMILHHSIGETEELTVKMQEYEQLERMSSQMFTVII